MVRQAHHEWRMADGGWRAKVAAWLSNRSRVGGSTQQKMGCADVPRQRWLQVRALAV